MRGRLPALLLAVLLVLAGCTMGQDDTEAGKLQIVATLFPQFDFARQIAGDRAQITLLIPPGVESHSYEPSPADIIRIQNADLFLYTGPYMEPWAETLLDSMDKPSYQVLDVSRGIPLDEEDGAHEEDELDHNHAGVDPHIWTSPKNAKTMADSILQALCVTDPAGEAAYCQSAEQYQRQLETLDRELEDVVTAGKRQELVFAGRFAFHYLFRDYGLTYISAYDSCSSETEPSVRAVADMIDVIRLDKLPAVYYEELTDPKVARAISEETGTEMLLLHSCHNVSARDMKAGVTYLSLMQQNVQHIRTGLG